MRRLALLVCLLASSAHAQHLVIVGGGSRPPEVMAEVVRLAGGPGARVAVVPHASGDPAGTAAVLVAELAAAGAAPTAALGHPDADSTLAALAGATGVFLSGGDQNRLVAALRGTRLLAAVEGVLARGGVVAGTSAGAAAMSRTMLTGRDLAADASGTPFTTLTPRAVETSEGFGFADRLLGVAVVVDQHFAARRRQNRLLAVLLDGPARLGFGVDEETALVVGPGGGARVVGRRGVQVVDARAAAVEVRAGAFSARGLGLHLLADGDAWVP